MLDEQYRNPILMWTCCPFYPLQDLLISLLLSHHESIIEWVRGRRLPVSKLDPDRTSRKPRGVLLGLVFRVLILAHTDLRHFNVPLFRQIRLNVKNPKKTKQ